MPKTKRRAPSRRTRRNPQPVPPSVTFRVSPSRGGADWRIWHRWVDSEARAPMSFLALGIDEDATAAMVNAAVAAMSGDPWATWEDYEFSDGTMVNDPSAATVYLRRATVRSGLHGDDLLLDVTVTFPRESRYAP